ncbi:Protein Asterix, partial [Trichinella sp. T6]
LLLMFSKVNMTTMMILEKHSSIGMIAFAKWIGTCFINNSFRCCSTSNGANSTVQLADVQEYDDTGQKLEIEQLDISRMSRWHRMKVHCECPPMDMFRWQRTRKALRKRYAMYGRASGVDPGLLWPSSAELVEQQLEDDLWRPKLLETIEMEKAEIERKQQDRKNRLHAIELNLKNYGKLLKEYESRIQKKNAEALTVKLEKERKIREIQDFLGYAADPTDPKVVEYLEKKKQEEKKVMNIMISRLYFYYYKFDRCCEDNISHFWYIIGCKAGKKEGDGNEINCSGAIQYEKLIYLFQCTYISITMRQSADSFNGRYKPVDPSAPPDDPVADYMNILGMIFSMCGLMMRLKWCAWVALYCSFVSFSNSKITDDAKQIVSSFMLSISSVVMCYLQNPTPINYAL